MHKRFNQSKKKDTKLKSPPVLPTAGPPLPHEMSTATPAMRLDAAGKLVASLLLDFGKPFCTTDNSMKGGCLEQWND